MAAWYQYVLCKLLSVPGLALLSRLSFFFIHFLSYIYNQFPARRRSNCRGPKSRLGRQAMSSSSAPPATLPPGAYDSQAKSLYASCVPVTFFATIAVLLRFYAKRLAKSYVWWDDWLIVVALVRRTTLTDRALIR